MKNNFGEAAVVPAKASERGSKRAVLREEVLSQPCSLLNSASRRRSLKRGPGRAPCSKPQEAPRGEQFLETCRKTSCALSLLWPRSSCLIRVGSLVLSSAALPSTWEGGNELPSVVPSPACWLLPTNRLAMMFGLAVKLRVQLWFVLFFLCSLLFVALGALTVRGCPCYRSLYQKTQSPPVPLKQQCPSQTNASQVSWASFLWKWIPSICSELGGVGEGKGGSRMMV